MALTLRRTRARNFPNGRGIGPVMQEVVRTSGAWIRQMRAPDSRRPSGVPRLLQQTRSEKYGNQYPKATQRESEGPIVVLKRGNARGAKGPYYSCATEEKERAD